MSLHHSYLNAIHEITIQILNRTDVTELLTDIVTHATALVEAQLGGISLINEEKNCLELKATVGYSSALHHLIKRKEGFIGKVWSTGQIRAVQDYQAWNGRFLDQDLDSIHATIGVPLKLKGQVIGVFFLSYMNPAAKFTRQKIKALELFARLAALALHQAKLHSSLKDELKQRILNEQQLQHMVYRDPITGLLNRNYLFHKVSEKLSSQLTCEKIAFLMLSLNGLNVVSELAGSAIADELIKEFPQRIANCNRENVTVIYLGGNQFVLIMEQLDQELEIQHFMESLLASYNKPCIFEQQEYYLTINAGMAFSPLHGQTLDQLMKNATIALTKAKAAGENEYLIFKPAYLAEIHQQVEMKQQLHNALINEEFVIFYQPRVNTMTGKITALEALLRWQSPSFGLVSPADFIPLLESSGLIIPVGEWVLRKVCQEISNLEQANIHIGISVNLSPHQFRMANLSDMILDAIAKAGVKPSSLEIEITENTCTFDVNHAIQVLNKLKKAGIKVAMDDFGVGQSSLINLKRLPIDTLKIDRSFIQDVDKSVENLSIVQTIIELAKILCLKVVAEGVETLNQLNYLRQYECHEIQGYYFYKPLPRDIIFAKLLKQ